MDNIKTCMTQCGYPDWEFKAVETKLHEEKTKKRKKDEKKENSESSGRLVVLPCVKGLPETTARIMKRCGRTCASKPENTLDQHLFRLKADSMKMADVI